MLCILLMICKVNGCTFYGDATARCFLLSSRNSTITAR